MYSTCLHCHKPLGRNDAVEHFPVGRRLAFDSAKVAWGWCASTARAGISRRSRSDGRPSRNPSELFARRDWQEAEEIAAIADGMLTQMPGRTTNVSGNRNAPQCRRGVLFPNLSASLRVCA